MSSLNEVKIVNDKNFDEAVRRKTLTVIDCWAPWCGPCRIISPVIEELAGEYQDGVAFGKLNVDENIQTAQKFRITAIPTLLFFKEGKHVDTLIGAVPKSTIKNKIQGLI